MKLRKLKKPKPSHQMWRHRRRELPEHTVVTALVTPELREATKYRTLLDMSAEEILDIERRNGARVSPGRLRPETSQRLEELRKKT